MKFISDYFLETAQLSHRINKLEVEELVKELVSLRERQGRLFLIGVGGSAANCSHAVNDFRKLCHIEAYSPVDNVSELTARTNDDGWETIFSSWLKTSRACCDDVLFVLSVGGGDETTYVSPNIVEAVKWAKINKMKVLGIVGPRGGYTKEHGDCVIAIPVENQSMITPLAEAFQAVIWHCLVSHPMLKKQAAKWESLEVIL